MKKQNISMNLRLWVFYKTNKLLSDFITKKNIQSSKKYGNLIYCIELNDKINPSEMISKWDIFMRLIVKK